jgi:predicted nucleic acid-binding protein
MHSVITIVDAAPLVAAADRRDPQRATAQQALQSAPGRLIVPAQVTAEVDYLMMTRLGPEASLAFVRDIAAGRLEVACLDPWEYAQVADLSVRYADLKPGLADLAVVVLAARFETGRVMTFDHRHFRTLRPLTGGAFTLVPADGP